MTKTAITIVVLAIGPGLGFLTTVVAARLLPVTDAAAFFLLLAIIPVSSEAVAFGISDLMMREVVRDKAAYPDLTAAFFGSLWSAVPISIIGATISLAIIPGPGTTTFFAILFDVLGSRVAIHAEYSAIAYRQISLADFTRLLSSVARFLGVGFYLFLLHGRSGVEAAFAGGALVLTFAMVLTAMNWRRFGTTARLLISVQAAVFPFYVANLIRVLQQNSDRIVVAAVMDQKTFAVYAIISRALQFSAIPIVSVLRQNYAAFVEAGRRGVNGAVAYARARASLFAGAGCVGALIVCAFAFAAPPLFGKMFASGQLPTLVAGPSLIIMSAIYLGCEVLTAAGHQQQRVAVIAIQASIQAAGQAFLASVYGLLGAVGGIYAGGIIATTYLFFVIVKLFWRERLG